jgi:HK97 family phage prohead protease
MLEHKFIPAAAAAIKVFAEKGEFVGYASTFGNVDQGGDVILPGAYRKSLRQKRTEPLLVYFQHDYMMPIGKIASAEEDEVGLRVSGELTPGHSLAKDVAAGMAHGTIWGMSVGIVIPPGGAKRDDKTGIRTIKEADLKEVSLTNMPMNRAARISLDSVKSMLDAVDGVNDIEALLREAAGFSREAAKAAISRFRAVLLRDAGGDGGNTSSLAPILARMANLVENTTHKL